MRLRPMRSERWPNSGIETKETQDATSTATSKEIARHFQRAGAIGEDEGGEDIEGRLFHQPRQGGEQDLLWLLADDFRDGRACSIFLSRTNCAKSGVSMMPSRTHKPNLPPQDDA